MPIKLEFPIKCWGLIWWCRPLMPTTPEAKIGGSEVQGLPGLQSKFKTMVRKLMRSHLKRNKRRGRWGICLP